jgi:SMODS and SLOG-associating 2TM effector domain
MVRMIEYFPVVKGFPDSGPDKNESIGEITSPLTRERFREWVGMNKSKVPRKGLYEKVVSRGKAAQTRYFLSSSVGTICIVIQIAVGATLTALGASKAHPVVLTVLGLSTLSLLAFWSS